MSTKLDSVLDNIYYHKPTIDLVSPDTISVSSYTSSYIFNIFIVILFLCLIIAIYMRISINYALNDWNQYKCDPKYLFVSGNIVAEEGKTANDTTRRNIQICAHRAYKPEWEEVNIHKRIEHQEQMNQLDLANERLSQSKRQIKSKIKKLDNNISNNHESIKASTEQIKKVQSRQRDKIDDAVIKVDNVIENNKGIFDKLKETARDYFTYLHIKNKLAYDKSNKSKDKQKYDTNMSIIENILYNYLGGPTPITN